MTRNVEVMTPTQYIAESLRLLHSFNKQRGNGLIISEGSDPYGNETVDEEIRKFKIEFSVQQVKLHKERRIYQIEENCEYDFCIELLLLIDILW